MTLTNITGAPVEGENFFGREKELDFDVKQIKAGNSLILSAPRRVGKSSFAKKVLEILGNDGWNTVEINLEEVKISELPALTLVSAPVLKLVFRCSHWLRISVIFPFEVIYFFQITNIIVMR